MGLVTRYMHDTIEVAIIESQQKGDYVPVDLAGEHCTLHATHPTDRGFFTVHINGYDMGTFHADRFDHGKTIARRVALGMHNG